MQASFHLKEEIYKKIQNKSLETGIKSDDLVNEILNQGLENYPNTIKLSDKFHELWGICEQGEEDNIIEVRDKIREKNF